MNFTRQELAERAASLAVLGELPPVAVVIVDGYVWLDGVSSATTMGAVQHLLAVKRKLSKTKPERGG